MKLNSLKYLIKHACIRLIMLGIVSFAGCVVLVSCAIWLPSPDDITIGPPFKNIDNIPPNTGLVYLYRPPISAFVSGSYSYVKANGKVICGTINESYYPYFAKPGKTEFDMDGATVAVDVQAGHTYFVRVTVKGGFSHIKEALELVAPDIGEKEIKDCNLALILPTLP